MGSLYQFPEGQIVAFALVFLRIMAFVIAWPVFGASSVPAPVKILLALTMSMVVFPVVSFSNADLIKFGEEIIFLSIREIALGLILGFLMRMFFFAVTVAGDIISVSMGLGAAQLFNPSLGAQTNVIEQFESMLATLFFLMINGHHMFIGGLAHSFTLVPVSDVALKVSAFSEIVNIATQVFIIGLKISAPVVVAIFMTNIAMGVLGRAVPQINVLITSMPVTILLGLAVLIVTTPLFVVEMNGLLDVMTTNFFSVMKGL